MLCELAREGNLAYEPGYELETVKFYCGSACLDLGVGFTREEREIAGLV